MASLLPAALLALAIAQGVPPGQGRAEDGAAPQESADASQQPASPPGYAEPEVPAGIPYMPYVGAARRPSDGLHLDAGILTELRARTLVADGGTTWGSDLEVTPGIALELGTPYLVLAAGYAPRFTIPFEVGGFELAILNRATARVEWRLDALWTVTGLGVFVFGDYSQLVPASTPAGPGPPPPVLNPIRSFQTYPYVGIDTMVRIDGVLTPRIRLRIAGGYFDIGGTGEIGELNQPRTWGPQAEASLAWDSSRTTTWTTAANAQNWMMSGNETFLITTLTEAWRQRWTSEIDTTFTAGAGFSNREVETRTALGKVVPVARAAFTYRTESRQPIGVSVDMGLAPYFDPYDRIPYQRFTAGASVDWRPTDQWRLVASFAGALAPYTARVPESYGTAGLSATYSPITFVTLSLGGFSQSQFQGGTGDGGTFRQWTGYFSVALTDRFSL